LLEGKRMGLEGKKGWGLKGKRMGFEREKDGV
jgi:hypothetical protein